MFIGAIGTTSATAIFGDGNTLVHTNLSGIPSAVGIQWQHDGDLRQVGLSVEGNLNDQAAQDSGVWTINSDTGDIDLECVKTGGTLTLSDDTARGKYPVDTRIEVDATHDVAFIAVASPFGTGTFDGTVTAYIRGTDIAIGSWTMDLELT